MTSIIKFTALQGIGCDEALCFLLQIDEARILLDCGWDERFDASDLDLLRRHAHQVDAVLLSHPDLAHAGALPYAVAHLGLACPVYATVPVHEMGQLFLYDACESRRAREEFDAFTLDDIDAAFARVVTMKYTQPAHLSGNGAGITVRPYHAGHSLGGAVWLITKEEETVLYAVDYNHRQERHLKGTALDTLREHTPTLMITDARQVLVEQPPRKERDRLLVNDVIGTMRNGGNVLMPIDTAARVLELALLFDGVWSKHKLGAYGLCLLNSVCQSVADFAQKDFEWMNDAIAHHFEQTRSNLFNFQNVRLCRSLAELHAVPSPKVVLASPPSLLTGFSLDLFVMWAPDDRNLVLLTSRPPPGTPGRQLLDSMRKGAAKIDVMPMKLKMRVALTGAELEEYRRQREEERERARADAAIAEEAARRERLRMRRGRPGEDDGDEDEDDADANEAATVLRFRHDLSVLEGGEAPGRPDSFFKQARTYPMFPAVETRRRFDEYGEVIRAADYKEKEKGPGRVGDRAGAAGMDVDVAPPSADGAARRKGEGEGAGAKMERAAKGEDDEPVPTKCVVEHRRVAVRCRLRFVDMEGRADGVSVRHILARVKPRQMAIVRGDAESAQALAAYCRDRGLAETIYIPHVGQVVDVTSERHIYQVKMKDSLMSTLRVARYGDYELARVQGRLCLSADDPTALPELEAVGDDERVPQEPIFVGDVLLTDFKQVLERSGLTARFSGGVLVCDEKVAVRRLAPAQFVLEGPLCSEYFRIRQLLYDQMAIL